MVRREFREEENRKHVHSPPELPVGGEDPGTHSPTPCMATTLIQDRHGVSLSRGTEIWARLGQTLYEASLSPRTHICKGNRSTKP